MPDPSTLMKLTKRLGPGLLEELNAELLALAVERKVLCSRRLRVDTTVLEADIRSPTDSGLCAHAVSRLTRLARRVKAAGLAPRARLRDRRRERFFQRHRHRRPPFGHLIPPPLICALASHAPARLTKPLAAGDVRA